MRLPEFDFFEPATVAEACALLAAHPDESAVFAGGTDVLVNLKEGAVNHRRLVSLAGIEALHRISYSAEQGLCIGAMATVNQVAGHQEILQRYPGIVDAAHCLAADQVRNLATVAGNLCSAVPSADMAPVLLAHGAVLRATSPSGSRTIPIRELFTGPRQTVLDSAEVVTEIVVPPPASGQGGASQRIGGRQSLSLPIASAAAVVILQGDICTQETIALGSVAPTPLLAQRAGLFITGKQLSDEVLAEAGELASAAARPIDDLRGGKEYRHELVRVLTRRVLTVAAERAAAEQAQR